MSEPLLAQFEEKLDQLINKCHQLTAECQGLRERQADWESERARLVEKNEIARARIESMLARLKKLETDTP